MPTCRDKACHVVQLYSHLKGSSLPTFLLTPSHFISLHHTWPCVALCGPHIVSLPILAHPPQVELHGLTVAFLDGTYNAAAFHADAPAPNYSPYFTRSEVEALKEALSTLTGEVDVLLTCEWPKGVTSGGCGCGGVRVLLLRVRRGGCDEWEPLCVLTSPAG